MTTPAFLDYDNLQENFEDSLKQAALQRERNKNRIVPHFNNQAFSADVEQFFESRRRQRWSDDPDKLYDYCQNDFNKALSVFINYDTERCLTFMYYDGYEDSNRKAFIVPATRKELAYVFTFPYIKDQKYLYREDLTNELLDWWCGRKISLPDDQQLRFTDTYKATYHRMCCEFLQSKEPWLYLSDMVIRLKDKVDSISELNQCLHDFLGSVYNLTYFKHGKLTTEISERHKQIEQMYNAIRHLPDTSEYCKIDEHWQYCSPYTKHAFAQITETTNCQWIVEPSLGIP